MKSSRNRNLVISEYFTCKTVMDESSLDFQEVKKKFSGPRNSLKFGRSKTSSNNRKPKKSVKGQKDIRSALKQNNDLLCYTKDFNKICKQSGIDIDGEQLQLAIALSKSLQQPETNLCNDPISSSLNSQERTGKIRITLQEYGFKIPEKKISSCNLKKSRKLKRFNKLISTTQTEKLQLISDKYSQVLFENNDSCKISDITTNNYCTDCSLFQMTSNVTYNSMKNNDLFYVKDLIERCPNCIGNLLRDWSEIPGRPTSPVLHEGINMNISEIDCSQEELDIVLSGSLKSCSQIFENKKFYLKDNFNGVDECSIVLENENVSNGEMYCAEKANLKFRKKDSDKNEAKANLELSLKTKIEEIMNIEEKSMSLVQRKQRSVSPDIFDDEVYTVTEKPNKTYTPSQNSENYLSCKSQDMDFTECVTFASILQPENSTNLIKVISQLPKENNKTTQKSNDFMEITDCVFTSLQPIYENIQNIDLTQSSDDDIPIVVEIKEKSLVITNNFDEDTLPYVNLNKTNDKSLEDTILLDHDECFPINYNVKKESPVTVVNDLETPNTDKLAMFSNKDRSSKYKELFLSKEQFIENDLYHFDHISTQSPDASNLTSCTNKNITVWNKSQAVDFQYEHIENPNRNEIVVGPNDVSEIESQLNAQTDYSNNEDSNFDILKTTSKIDLTQISDISNVTSSDSSIKIIDSQHLVENSGLGQNFDISVDYDEIIDRNNPEAIKGNNYDNCPVQEVVNLNSFWDNDNIHKIDNIGADVNKSERMAMHQYDINSFEHNEKPVSNFNFAGIPILDNRKEASSKESLHTVQNVNKNATFQNDLRHSTTDFKNELSGNSVQIKVSTAEICTPYKEFIHKNISEATPNNKYIIKTEEITPLLDYNSMSTPKINKELEKYGLKPFKRKRAVQLLTHLYYQTHPIVEQCSSGELSSPSKKRKFNVNTQSKSPLKKSPIKSPKKVKSPKKSGSEQVKASDKENNMYAVTTELPDIKLLECNADDWIFQKREKAKVYSCRVPLHIAFHNYVSCRRALQEAILRYEPINIDVIHKELTASGHRYDPKDLLKFLDKKCITVKTADSNSRKRH